MRRQQHQPQSTRQFFTNCAGYAVVYLIVILGAIALLQWARP